MQRPPGAFIPLTVDSGCNQTLVQSPRWFIDGSYAEEKSGAIYINGASESGNTTGNLRVHGFGDAQLTTICSRTGNLVDIRMPGAQYVPDLSVDMLMAWTSKIGASRGHCVEPAPPVPSIPGMKSRIGKLELSTVFRSNVKWLLPAFMATGVVRTRP